MPEFVNAHFVPKRKRKRKIHYSIICSILRLDVEVVAKPM